MYHSGQARQRIVGKLQGEQAWLIWFIWFVLFIWLVLVQPNKPNRPNKPDQPVLFVEEGKRL